LEKVKKLEEFDIGGGLKGLIVKMKSFNLKSFALRLEMEGGRLDRLWIKVVSDIT